MLEERSGVTKMMMVMVIFQDRKADSVGAADGRLELHDPILQKQLL